MISSALESTSLENVDMMDARFQISSESAFRRIVLACSGVESLRLHCNTTSQFASVAALIQNPSSIVWELDMCWCDVDDENLTIIATSLAGNTTVRNWYAHYCGIRNMCSVEKLLCDTSSIEGIYNSNHTLGILECLNDLSSLAVDCLEPNAQYRYQSSNERLIREKIARYYFVGDFDISMFARMPLSYLPRVLAMIKCDVINRQSAIFKILKTIPELCNVSIRGVQQVGVDRHKVSKSAKRQKNRK